MLGDRSRLDLLVPFAKLLPPELLLDDLLGALEALRDLLLCRHLHGAVCEAVGIRHLHPVEEQPVIAGEIVGAPLDGVGMGLRPVTGRRSGEVHRIQRPEPGAGWIESKLRCRARIRHRRSSLSPSPDLEALPQGFEHRCGSRVRTIRGGRAAVNRSVTGAREPGPPPMATCGPTGRRRKERQVVEAGRVLAEDLSLGRDAELPRVLLGGLELGEALEQAGTDGSAPGAPTRCTHPRAGPTPDWPDPGPRGPGCPTSG